MKKTLAFIVLVTLLVNCTHTIPHYFDYERKRPIVISKRVGETIEPDERERFGLFSGIEDFKAATFYGIKGGGYEVEILTDHERLIAVNHDPRAADMLKDYIERYEEVGSSPTEFEKKWNIADHDQLGQPITNYEINHVKGSGFAIGLGCGCSGVASLGFAYFVFWKSIGEAFEGGTYDLDWVELLVTGGSILVTIMGVLLGNHLDKKSALDMIKEARKPRVVE